MNTQKQPVPYAIIGLNPYPWIQWWYFLTSPPAPTEPSQWQEREFLRRGQLVSIALLIQLIELLLLLWPATQDGTQTTLPLILISIGILIIVTLLNRFRKLTVAGLLFTISTEAGIFLTMAFLAGGQLGITSLPFFSLLIQPIIISILLFPPWGVLVVGTMNVLLMSAILLFFPLTNELQMYAQTVAAFPLFMVPPVTMIVCTLVCFIVITSWQDGLRRADQALETVQQQQALAEQAHEELQAKHKELQAKYELEAGIQEMLTGLTRFANGEMQARIQLEQSHTLWPVASNINHIMSRIVRLTEQEQPMEQTYIALQTALMAIRTAKVRGTPLSLPQTGTEVDVLAEEMRTYLSMLQQPRKGK